MRSAVKTAICGSYEVVAQRDGTLLERDDGAVELFAEGRYLVRLGEGADPRALRGALTILDGAHEGLLQFGNFIGETRLGGRRLVVRSSRLSAASVQEMFDSVSGHLASLPFLADTPTVAPYARDRAIGPDALYHAYVCLRDAMEARGRHDLPGAIERILARPHESLLAQEPRLVPLGQSSRVDASTLIAIVSEPQFLSPIRAGSPLESHPLARQLGGRMPEMVRTSPLAHSTDNRENRFVAATLEITSDIARQFEQFARRSSRPSSSLNTREAAAFAARLDRWRRHPALERLNARRSVPVQSTVLRGRAGYRELLRFYSHFISRTGLAGPNDRQSLLELRDAAEIYEYWCYFQVVEAVAEIVGASPVLSRFAATPLGTRVPYGYEATVGATKVLYNVTYSRPAHGQAEIGHDSYSVRLRPDITLRASSGSLHLFDAKLKVDFASAADADDEDDPGRTDTFKREDLYKMHAYRDALGAQSVWVLYPGTGSEPDQYGIPWMHDPCEGAEFRGVGAIALRPGAKHDGGLRERVRILLGGTGPA
jgi:predicted component of viral defense system (DUF524 family)